MLNNAMLHIRHVSMYCVVCTYLLTKPLVKARGVAALFLRGPAPKQCDKTLIPFVVGSGTYIHNGRKILTQGTGGLQPRCPCLIGRGEVIR